MSKFEQDRKIEREAIAIINYFILLAKAELAAKQNTVGHDEHIEIFTLINGEDNSKQLIIDCNESDIDIFNNDVEQLYNQLKNNMRIINSITFSKSGLTEQTVKMFNVIEKIYSGGYGIYTVPKFINHKDSAFEQLTILPIPAEIKEKLKKLKPIEKKIGER